MKSKDAIELVMKRNAFYRRVHHLAIAALYSLVFVIVFLACVLVYLWRNPTHPIYFATDNVGRLIRIVPINQPNATDEDVVNWAIEAMQATFSMDYVNYRMQLQGAQKYFTDYGWTNYMNAIEAANNISALTTRKMIVLVKVVSQPRIVAEGILGGAYAWKIEMPMLATYSLPLYDETTKFSNPINITIVVQRQPILQSYKGLGIAQIIGTIAQAPISQPQQISNTPTG